jgi:hypothetical protein
LLLDLDGPDAMRERVYQKVADDQPAVDRV